MFRKVGIITREGSHNPEVQLQEVFKVLQQKKVKDILLDETSASALNKSDNYQIKDILNSTDLILLLGGDGTLLGLAKHLKKSSPPILTINTGTVGFLTEVEKELVSKELPKAFEKGIEIDQRDLIAIKHIRNDKILNSYQALNDAVVAHGSKARLIDMEVSINNRKVNNYQADGLIVATPTGSTAHALSAGGPIIHPHIKALVLAPICPISLATRPLVIPMNREVKIKVATFRERHESVTLTIDGQISVPVDYQDEIVIKLAKPKLNLVRLQEENYYDQLKRKLRWG